MFVEGYTLREREVEMGWIEGEGKGKIVELIGFEIVVFCDLWRRDVRVVVEVFAVERHVS